MVCGIHLMHKVVESKTYGSLIYTYIATVEPLKTDGEKYVDWCEKYHPKRYFSASNSVKKSRDNIGGFEIWVPLDLYNLEWKSTNKIWKKLPVAHTIKQVNKWIEKSKFILTNINSEVLNKSNFDVV